MWKPCSEVSVHLPSAGSLLLPLCPECPQWHFPFLEALPWLESSALANADRCILLVPRHKMHGVQVNGLIRPAPEPGFAEEKAGRHRAAVAGQDVSLS